MQTSTLSSSVKVPKSTPTDISTTQRKRSKSIENITNLNLDEGKSLSNLLSSSVTIKQDPQQIMSKANKNRTQSYRDIKTRYFSSLKMNSPIAEKHEEEFVTSPVINNTSHAIPIRPQQQQQQDSKMSIPKVMSSDMFFPPDENDDDLFKPSAAMPIQMTNNRKDPVGKNLPSTFVDNEVCYVIFFYTS